MSAQFCTAINVASLEFKEPQMNRNGGKSVSVSTVPGSIEWNDRIRFQTCEDQRTNLQTSVLGFEYPYQRRYVSSYLGVEH